MVGRRRNLLAAGRAAFAVVAVALLAAACSSNSASSSSTTSVAATSSAASSAAKASSPGSSATSSAAKASASGSATAAGAATVTTGSGALGVYLVDGQGRTLYMYDADTTAGQSACYDACATAWPPFVTTGTPTATGSGLDSTKVTTLTRTDGSRQVVYGEYPLYYFEKDTAAGDTTGQAVGGTWWVVGADGEPIKAAAATSSSGG